MGLAALWQSASGGNTADFQVDIKERTILLSGGLPDETFAAEIQATLASACPQHTIDLSGVVFDPAPAFPALADLRPLLAELGISTVEGRLEIWPDRIVIGGLTDSQVTLSALTVRLRSLLTTRRLVNRICIVSTDDLPRPDLLLADESTSTRAGGARRRRGASFEPPGIGVHKLPGLIAMLDRVESFVSKAAPDLTPSPPLTPLPLRASPLEESATEAAPTTLTMLATPLEMPIPQSPIPIPLPGDPFAPVGRILFSRNTALFQSNQDQNLADMLTRLNSPTFQGQAIRLEAIKASDAPAALLDYLCERRLDEATSLLTTAGIAKSLISRRITADATAIDSGEMRVSAEALILPAAPAAPAPEIPLESAPANVTRPLSPP
jgi:hypothetical protein